jgi:hypothetical protein
MDKIEHPDGRRLVGDAIEWTCPQHLDQVLVQHSRDEFTIEVEARLRLEEEVNRPHRHSPSRSSIHQPHIELDETDMSERNAERSRG